MENALSSSKSKEVWRVIHRVLKPNQQPPLSFRKGQSTTTVFLGIKDDLIHAMKRKEVVLMALADYSKAFDTVCFKTLINKLYSLGFSKNFLIWLMSYT